MPTRYGNHLDRKPTLMNDNYDSSQRRLFTPLSTTFSHSSFIPSLDEQFTIEGTISEVRCTITSVDDEIQSLQLKLEELKEYRNELHLTLGSLQAPLSPIRKLPPEILSEIFLFAAAGSSIRWPSRRDDSDMPWLLGKICSYWRTVSLSLPQLWSDIHLDHKFFPGAPPSSKTEEFLRLCLDRSRNERLTFSVDTRNPGSFVRPVILTLLSHSERWKDASFDADLLSTYHGDLVLAKHKVPNLRRVHFGLSPLDSVPSLTPLDAFEDAPQLSEISVIGIVHPCHFLRVSWSQITHFTSKGSTFREGEFTQIMQQMTNLVAFSTEGERILEVASSQPVLLPHLTKLTIINKGSYISKTSQFLTVPRLQDLSIHAITPFIAEQTLSMLTRSGCAPDRLSFRASLDMDALWDENRGVVWLLGALPSLRYLHLTVLRSAEHIMPRLANRNQASLPAAILPNLETFVLEDRFCVSAAELTAVLSSRIRKFNNGVWGPEPEDERTGLRSISLRLSRPAAPKFPELDLLKTIAENHGVDIVIDST